MEIPDFARTFVLGQACFAGGLAYAVFVHHLAHRDACCGLPFRRWQIIAFAASYLILSIVVAAIIMDKWAMPLTWRTPVSFVAFGLGDVALMTAFRDVRRAAKNKGGQPRPDPV
jgi:hypothetical protein